MKKSIHVVIILCFMLLFGFLPPIGAITPFGMKVLGIFIGCIYAYSLEMMMWPSILALVILTTVQGQTILATMQTAFSNQVLWQVTWALIFCYALNKCGLISIIGKWVVSRKFARKGPYWLMFAFWLACFLISMLTLQSLPIMIMMWTVFFEIADEVGIKRHSKYANIVLIGMAIMCYLGQVFFPYNPWSSIVFGIFTSMEYTDLPGYGSYMAFAGIVSVIYFVVIIVISKFLLRPQIDFNVADISVDEQELRLNKVQKIALVSVVVMILFLLVPPYLPSEWLIVAWAKKMGFVGGMVFVILLLSILPSATDPNKKVIDLTDVVKNGVNWSSFFMLANVFYMATLITNESTGILVMLKGILDPLLSGKSVAVTIFFLLVAGAIITNCLNNVVTASLLVPIALAFCETNAVNPQILVIGFAILLVQGCVLPTGSAVGGVLHSWPEAVKSKVVYLYASIYTIALAVVVAIVAILLH